MSMDIMLRMDRIFFMIKIYEFTVKSRVWNILTINCVFESFLEVFLL